MSFEDQILLAVRAAMPPNAHIQVVPGTGIGAFNVGVSWKFNDHLKRPGKMFNTIWICVPHEVAHDFASALAADQGGPYQRVAAFLSAKLTTFDPQHNLPNYEAPLMEQWTLDSTVMLG